jgi:uncharacterized protein DUF6282
MIARFSGISVKQLKRACLGAWIGLLLVSVAGNARAQSEADLNLKGAIDFRVHSSPESFPRSIDADDVARLAKENGMRALVLANHNESTAALAYMVRKAVPGIEVFGGIMLNQSVGGLNTEAVKRMTMMKGGYGRIVWFPTSSAENFLTYFHTPGPGVPVAKDGHLVPAALDMIGFIAQNHQLVLATGHLSAEEASLVVHEAHLRGVTHIVVTNPLGIFTHMTLPAMQQAAREGAYFEFIYNSVIGDKPQNTIKEYAEGIKRIGPQFCIIATDFGAVDVPYLPFHPQALLEFMEALREQGISVKDINLMVKTNPARLLGLEP